MSAPTYRWGSPLEWLMWKVEGGEWGSERLARELISVARLLDSDTLQDEYQSDMDADGYFSPERAE